MIHHDYEKFRLKALAIGVSDAEIILPSNIVIDPGFAAMCETGQCTGFGRGGNCPPNSISPEGFRKKIDESNHVLVFRVVVSSETLYGDSRYEVAGFIHETAAILENYIIGYGYKAKGFAGGPCKDIFCSEYTDCSYIKDNGKCRFPDRARNSLSGAGVNFNELNKLLKWENKHSFNMMAGLVLIRH